MKKERERREKKVNGQPSVRVVSPSNGLRCTCAAKLILTTKESVVEILDKGCVYRYKGVIRKRRTVFPWIFTPAACGFSTLHQSITPEVHCQDPFLPSLSPVQFKLLHRFLPVDNTRETF